MQGPPQKLCKPSEKCQRHFVALLHMFIFRSCHILATFTAVQPQYRCKLTSQNITFTFQCILILLRSKVLTAVHKTAKVMIMREAATLGDFLRLVQETTRLGI